MLREGHVRGECFAALPCVRVQSCAVVRWEETMTTKLSRLLREAETKIGEARAAGDVPAMKIQERLLAEAERLDAGGVMPLPNYYDAPGAIYDAGWLAACGGESE